MDPMAMQAMRRMFVSHLNDEFGLEVAISVTPNELQASSFVSVVAGVSFLTFSSVGPSILEYSTSRAKSGVPSSNSRVLSAPR